MDRHKCEPKIKNLDGKVKKYINEFDNVAAPSTHVGPFVWDYSKDAIGPYCKDVNNNVFLDFTSHVASNPLGYNHPELIELLDKFDSFAPLKIAGQDWRAHAEDYPGPKELMETLTDETAHYGLDTVFLSNSGAEAVENGIKICYDHQKGSYGLTFTGAFHGRTLGALSLNRSKSKYRRDFPSISNVETIPFCRNQSCTQNTCSCGFFTSDNESILSEKLLSKNSPIDPDDVSYMILEPIQGEGGYNIPSQEFMEEIEQVRSQTDIPLVVDEIQTGLGRSGEMWASDHYPIEPDVITVAKAAQVGATISNTDIFPDKKGRLSSTWGAGDILNSAIGHRTINVIKEQNLMQNATEKGQHLQETLEDYNLEEIKEIRGKGLLVAVEFDTQQTQEKVLEYAFKNGLLLLGCGTKTIRLLPPLNVTERECNQATEIIKDALN